MPLKLGLPPTLAGRVACACPDVRVMDMEITALTAAAAMATVIIEPERRSNMLVSFLPCGMLLLYLRDVTAATDPDRRQRSLCCPWFSDQARVLPQGRVLPCAVRAAAREGQNSLRCSAARNKSCSAHHSA